MDCTHLTGKYDKTYGQKPIHHALSGNIRGLVPACWFFFFSFD